MKSEISSNLILLAIGWLVLSVMIGLFQIFDFLEASTDSSQTTAMVAGLKMPGIIFSIGLIVISSVVGIFLRDKKREL